MSELPVKSKAQLRAERRAVQEAQRASKLAGKDAKHGSSTAKSSTLKANEQTSAVENAVVKQTPRQTLPNAIDKITPATEALQHDTLKFHRSGSFPSVPSRKQEPNRVNLFRHLKEPDRRTSVVENLGLGSSSPIHPAFIAFGVNLDEGRVWGSNEIALQFLSVCETLTRAQRPSSIHNQHSSSFTRQFGPILQRHFDFLSHCRSPTVAMQSAHQYMKQILNQLDSVQDWEECRLRLLSAINEFRQQSIYLAGAEIAERASVYIRPGDCICTFGYSSVVARVLLRAWSGNDDSNVPASEASEEYSKTNRCPSPDSHISSRPIAFSVLVVDARPKFKGRRMLTRLVRAGIPCEYTHIAALPTVAHKISLAIVGAAALLNNGYVLADIGAAQLANIVWAVSRSPTLVCAETYKFCERAYSDAFEFNELGDPDDVWRGPRGTGLDLNLPLPGYEPTGLHSRNTTPDLSDWRSNPRLHLLHLTYDVLPPALVSAVITEKGTLPTTSVPVVLRVKQASSFLL